MNKGITSEDYDFQVIKDYVGPQFQCYGDYIGCLQDRGGLYVEGQAPIHRVRGALVELKEGWVYHCTSDSLPLLILTQFRMCRGL